ncbi:MAG: TerB family tellurite resistance protein [Cytophagales bacterium]|nr:MAG: TerB family tellurite resistance protein [Cytophagales bacterium]
MRNKEKLYEAFGEMIYVLAKADGLIQDEEIAKLSEIVKQHPWGAEIQWSFDYEKNKNHPTADIYKKALDTFHQYGACPEYQYLLEILDAIATASNGIDAEEKAVVEKFQQDFKQRLIADLEKIQ